MTEPTEPYVVTSKVDSDIDRFEALFDQSPISMQLVDISGRTIKVNRAWETLWGATPDNGVVAFVMSDAYNIRNDPQLIEKGVIAFVDRAFAGESVRLPTVYYDPGEMNKPGRARWVNATIHPIKNRADQTLEIVLIHEDVTDRVNADLALKHTEEQLAFALDSASMVAWGVDLDSGEVWRSTTAKKVMGLSDGKIEEFFDLIHPDDREWLESAIARAVAGEITYDFEYRMILPTGRTIWLHDVGQRRSDPGQAGARFFGVAIDITVRKTGEERLKLATEAGHIGIWDYDLQTGSIVWSDLTYQILGMEVGDFDNSWEHFIALVYHDDRSLVMSLVEDAATAKQEFSAQFRIVHPDGTLRWLSNQAQLVRDRSNAVIRIVGSVIDVTERVRSEQKLRDADRRKDEFLAMLAHELRNPLAPITSVAEIMGTTPLDPAKTKYLGDIVNRQARHLTRLVDDLLDVSRVTRGLVTIDTRPLDLKAILSEAVEQIRPLIEANRHHLRVDLTAAVAHVMGDEQRLIQVVANLLNNAAKYTPPGGNIDLVMESDDTSVSVCVLDDGIGIALDMQSRVFELFEQVNSSGKQSGLGIGLALVKKLVELHGGVITCTSPGLNRGSSFQFRLPRLSERAVPNHVAEASIPFSLTKAPRRILIVDDNIDAAQMLAMYLEAVGHAALIEHDPVNVLEKLPALDVEVCILDIGLPGMDGFTLAKRIRTQHPGKCPVLIALTGFGQDDDRRRSRDAGFDYHITKPARNGELFAILDGLE